MPLDFQSLPFQKASVPRRARPSCPPLGRLRSAHPIVQRPYVLFVCAVPALRAALQSRVPRSQTARALPKQRLSLERSATCSFVAALAPYARKLNSIPPSLLTVSSQPPIPPAPFGPGARAHYVAHVDQLRQRQEDAARKRRATAATVHRRHIDFGLTGGGGMLIRAARSSSYRTKRVLPLIRGCRHPRYSLSVGAQSMNSGGSGRLVPADRAVKPARRTRRRRRSRSTSSCSKIADQRDRVGA